MVNEMVFARETTRQETRPAGTVYVSVLFTALIISVTTLAGLKLLDLRLKSAGGGSDALRARQLADSAMAIMLARVNANKDWRQYYVSGQETTREAWDGGTYWAVLSNSQDDLTILGNHTVDLTVHARYGQAGCGKSAILDPIFEPLDILKYSVIVRGDATIANGASISSDGRVRVYGLVKSGINSIHGQSVEATEPSLLGGLTSSVVGTLAPVLEPSNTSWIEEYTYFGTEISYAALDNGKIDKQVLSPMNNPFGPETNPLGIYLIRCGNQKVEIIKSRIEGTLALLDCKSGSKLKDDVHWNAVAPGMPALVVEGDFSIELAENSLDESAHSTNFNPLHTPYRGDGDNDENDFYPSRVRGLVVVTGNLEVDSAEATSLHGGLYVLGDLNQKTHLQVHRDDRIQTNPPPGFRTTVGMTIRNGTVRSVDTIN